MISAVRPDLDFDLPDGRGVDFPAPILPIEAYCTWLEEMFQEYVRQGVLEKSMLHPTRRLVEVPFRLD